MKSLQNVSCFNPNRVLNDKLLFKNTKESHQPTNTTQPFRQIKSIIFKDEPIHLKDYSKSSLSHPPARSREQPSRASAIFATCRCVPNKGRALVHAPAVSMYICVQPRGCLSRGRCIDDRMLHTLLNWPVFRFSLAGEATSTFQPCCKQIGALEWIIRRGCKTPAVFYGGSRANFCPPVPEQG
ncbi:hypothetical protein AVEN_259672-1 [Araneus ventricosus]|uniref:Uncharacterized protein n=1 Tax=Araneus ventricosus TaxID=182803 RepID=A0A4Y2Q8H9_ARAVE|nr:hypothetical protein AVEN_259672-1 [Araneus ventricosus]